MLLGILAILFLALRAANLGNFVIGDTYVVTARFDNIGGLKVRAPVKSAGVTVGRVKAIALDTNTYQGRVTMELEQGVMFPSDTSAKILTSGYSATSSSGWCRAGPTRIWSQVVRSSSRNPPCCSKI